MPELMRWWDWITVAIALTAIYFYQRSRWGIRLMTRDTMRAQMQKEIDDVLWNRFESGRLKLKAYIRLSNLLADIFDFPDLASVKRHHRKLKVTIKKRVALLKKTPNPKLPGEPTPKFELVVYPKKQTVVKSQPVRFNAA